MSIETFLNLSEDKKINIIKSGLMEFSSKNYQDGNTDVVIKSCGISKGSLYHYFGSKKGFYLYLLEHSISVALDKEIGKPSDDMNFYDILFHSLSEKFRLYRSNPLDFLFINTAAKEQCLEVFSENQRLLSDSMKKAQFNTYDTLQTAISRLSMKKNVDTSLLLRGLYMYVNAIITGYLKLYNDNPDAFFEDIETIKNETKVYIDMFLYGVTKEG